MFKRSLAVPFILLAAFFQTSANQRRNQYVKNNYYLVVPVLQVHDPENADTEDINDTSYGDFSEDSYFNKMVSSNFPMSSVENQDSVRYQYRDNRLPAEPSRDSDGYRENEPFRTADRYRENEPLQTKNRYRENEPFRVENGYRGNKHCSEQVVAADQYREKPYLGEPFRAADSMAMPQRQSAMVSRPLPQRTLMQRMNEFNVGNSQQIGVPALLGAFMITLLVAYFIISGQNLAAGGRSSRGSFSSDKTTGRNDSGCSNNIMEQLDFILKSAGNLQCAKLNLCCLCQQTEGLPRAASWIISQISFRWTVSLGHYQPEEVTDLKRGVNCGRLPASCKQDFPNCDFSL